MRVEKITISYTNPFAEDSVFQRFNVKARRSGCGRGMIISPHADLNDYLINGKLVTQRVGCSMLTLEHLIKHICDGEDSSCHLVQRAKNIYMEQV